MKLKSLLTLLCAFSLGFTVNAADDDTPLSKEMSAMNKSLRLIKRQLPDASKKADNLELLAKIKKNLDESHKLAPAKTEKQADKAAYTQKYKDQIVELGKAIGALEAAIKIDNQEEAKAALEKIQSLKEKGHETFEVE
ncbi:MAG: cytochrome b562 [Chthoniobacteraceae bacterium]